MQCGWVCSTIVMISSTSYFGQLITTVWPLSIITRQGRLDDHNDRVRKGLANGRGDDLAK